MIGLLLVGSGCFFSSPEVIAARGDESELRMRSKAYCQKATSESDLHSCYVSWLKNYRGRPQDLMQVDVRDAVAYCYYAAASNDGAFCGDLHDQYRDLFVQEVRRASEAAPRGGKQSGDSEAKLPKTISVTARGAGVVPGAIVCRDYQTVTFMIDWYVAHWSDKFADAIYKDQARLLRGSSIPSPHLSRYGCTLVSPGTPMLLEQGNIVPIVSVTSATGATIRGVTDPGMVQR